MAQIKVECGKKKSLQSTHWKGPHHCWIPNAIESVPAPDGRNTMYKNGTTTQYFVGDPLDETEWREQFAQQMKNRWFYNECQPRNITGRVLQCVVCSAISTAVCSRCAFTRYCGVDCQRQDWERHKQECYPLPSHLVGVEKNVILNDALELTLFNTFKKSSSANDLHPLWQGRIAVLAGLIIRILANPVDGGVGVSSQHANDHIYDGLNAVKMYAKEWSVYKETSEALYWRRYLWPYIPVMMHKEIADLYATLNK
jgi:MYND finger